MSSFSSICRATAYTACKSEPQHAEVRVLCQRGPACERGMYRHASFVIASRNTTFFDVVNFACMSLNMQMAEVHGVNWFASVDKPEPDAGVDYVADPAAWNDAWLKAVNLGEHINIALQPRFRAARQLHVEFINDTSSFQTPLRPARPDQSECPGAPERVRPAQKVARVLTYEK